MESGLLSIEAVVGDKVYFCMQKTNEGIQTYVTDKKSFFESDLDGAVMVQ